ncbi:ferredoxin reductase family protein [Porticoccus sp.]
MRQIFAHSILWIIGLLPTLVALCLMPFDSFGDVAAVLNTLGRLAGIAGLGLFLVAAITSFRVVGFDTWFGGLTKLWKTHHLLGAVAFLLLLAHPLLLALANVRISLDSAVVVLLPKENGTATWVGWGSLLSMMIFLAPSFAFFGRSGYQRWKKLHRLSGLAALLAVIHTLMLERALPYPWGEIIWLVLITVAGISLVYSLVLKRCSGEYRYTVENIDHPANNVVELGLHAEGKSLSYQPGQFVYLTHHEKELAGCGEEHPYTLSSVPDDPLTRITIKALGDTSFAVQQIPVGSRVSLNGPYGAFFPQHNHDKELWIAGGIGITPFLGRARYLANCQAQVDIDMIYCVQDEARALFADELGGIEKTLDGFSLTLHYFYQHGPLDTDSLRYHCPDILDRKVYICGPLPLIQLAVRLALAGGVPRKNLYTEEFDLL